MNPEGKSDEEIAIEGIEKLERIGHLSVHRKDLLIMALMIQKLISWQRRLPLMDRLADSHN